MAANTAERREKLAERLVAAALARIERDGLAALRARDLAKDAGCAVGAIYTVFKDLDALVLAANAVTFREMGAAVQAAVAAEGAAGPEARMVAMGHAYLAFAEAHTNRWLALFDVNITGAAPPPDWYLRAMAALFDIIRAPLQEVRPGLSAAEADIAVRTLFSGVHGLVLLGIQRRISAVPESALKPAIAQLITALARVT